MTAAVDAAITRLAREESGRILALLARRFGDLDLADEAVQEALIRAHSTWQSDGIPRDPAAWLYTVARNLAVDRMRRAAAERRRIARTAHDILLSTEPEEVPAMIDDDAYSPAHDEQLRLMLLCCHPALDRDTQVALTLRLVGGLTTGEIAAAFLVPEATMAQRIVRAKRKIRDAGIPLSIPTALGSRVTSLLAVLYLVYNEGYLSRSRDGMRVDLADEAIRLTHRAVELLPDEPEVHALLALELYGRARADSRIDAVGELVLLAEQDRSTWDLALIDVANRAVATALAFMRPGSYQLQALIAAQHANAREAADTDWSTVATLYAQLEQMTGSPVVALNRAVAVAMADGPRAGLALLDDIAGLDSYHLWHATRAELLVRVGRTDAALASFATAASLAVNATERRHLERRAREVRAAHNAVDE